MVKKIICFITLLTVLLAFPLTANAEDSDAVIGRAYVYKPIVNVELYNVKDNVNDCKVSLGNSELSVESYKKYNPNVHKSVVYLLIDKSVSNDSFNTVKSSMCKFVNSLTEKTELVYITFGNSVSKPVVYKSCNSKAKKEINKNISNIKCNESNSVLYDAMTKTYNLSVTENEKYDRRYVVVASNGNNDTSQNSTQSQTKSLYESHMLPVFSLCSSLVEYSDNLNNLSTVSGGKIFKYKNNSNNNTVNNLNNYVNKNVLLIKSKSANNKLNSVRKTLSVELNGKAVRTLAVPIHSIRDDVAPKAKIEFNENEYYKFTVTFSEKVNYADDYSKYKIEHNGELCEVSEVRKINDVKYEVIMKDPISSGDYNFTFDNIVDNSIQHNNAEPTSIKDVTSNKYIIKNIIIFGSIGLAIVIIIALTIILLLRKKKKNAEIIERKKQVIDHFGSAESEVQHRVDFQNVTGVDITLTVTKQGTVAQIIKSTVCGSLMVGRGEICDICIDDKQMSRQHFALEENNKSIIITDLETLNGTYVNSYKLTKPQRLNNGDEIIAGSCKIKFNYRNGE